MTASRSTTTHPDARLIVRPDRGLIRAHGRSRRYLLVEVVAPTVGSAADLVAALVAELGLPRSLRDVGVGRERFAEIGAKSMHDRAVLNNPRPITRPEQVVEILELAA